MSVVIGLPNLTFVGVAAALGVSHMALYKHVANIEAFKCLVAEEVFQRWQIPRAGGDCAEGLQAYLTRFAASVQAFVKAHPGLTPYVIRRLAATEAMIDKINDHQAHIAQAYGLSLEQARWLLSTVAFHGFAVADTVSGREPLLEADRAGEESEMEVELLEGMQALPVLGQAPDISTPRYFFANPAEVPPALYTAPDISQGNVPHMEYLEWAACRMAMLPVKPGVVSHCNG